MNAILSSEYEAWQTPPDLFRALNAEFNFELDAAAAATNRLCPRFYDEQADGLSQPWVPYRTWCNPPRAVKLGHRADPWVAKAVEEARAGALVVMLLRSAVETDWFNALWDAPAEIRFLRPRVRYWRDGKEGPSPTFPSFLAVLRPGLPAPPPPTMTDWRELVGR